jgi:hypothetical protein
MRAVILFTAAYLAGAAAHAAELNSFQTQKRNTVVTLAGEIAAGDSQSLNRIIQGSDEANRSVTEIRLNSPGGSLAEAAKLAGIIRHGKIATILPPGARCASACFIVFAAGNEKFASYEADLGVHGAADKSGREAAAASILMHKSLGGISPAMGSGLTARLWSMEELAQMIDATLPMPGRRGPYKERASN